MLFTIARAYSNKGEKTLDYLASHRNLLIGLLLLAAPAAAETPDLQPGLWAHHSTVTIEGPMNLPPQTSHNQECLTQQKLDNGIDALNIPESCTISRADIKRSRVDYAASCTIQGVTTLFEGYATFHGTRLEGKMSSSMETPLGTMLMKTDYKAERIGDC